MADRRRTGGDWQGRGQEPGRGTRREDMGRGRTGGMGGRGYGYREEERDRDRFGGGSDLERGRGMGRDFTDREVGRYGRAYEYGGDEDRGRFDQDSREEYQRGGLMRGASGHHRAGGPGDEMGEGSWREMTRERTLGDFNRYGERSAARTPPYDRDRWDRGTYGPGAGTPGQRGGEDYRRYGTGGWISEDVASLPPRERPQYMERPGIGYSTSPTRDMDRDTGHGAGHGGMQGAYPYYEPSPELPRRQGRGPRNYQRSDERIREDICERLMQAWMDADDVDVRVEKAEVTLSGTVMSRDEKRAIEDLAEDTLGVKEVHNELRVAREQPRQGEEQREDRGTQTGRTLHS